MHVYMLNKLLLLLLKPQIPTSKTRIMTATKNLTTQP